MRTGYHSFCGCCGRPCNEVADWCEACVQHVDTGGNPPWERTYFALTGNPCPNEDINACGVCSAHRKPAPVDVSDNAWLKDRVEAEVETAAERIRAIPWCTPAMATNADHIARAVLETFFDTPTEAGHASPTAVLWPHGWGHPFRRRRFRCTCRNVSCTVQ